MQTNNYRRIKKITMIPNNLEYEFINYNDPEEFKVEIKKICIEILKNRNES